MFKWYLNDSNFTWRDRIKICREKREENRKRNREEEKKRYNKEERKTENGRKKR